MYMVQYVIVYKTSMSLRSSFFDLFVCSGKQYRRWLEMVGNGPLEPCDEVLAVAGGFEPLGSPNFHAMLLD